MGKWDKYIVEDTQTTPTADKWSKYAVEEQPVPQTTPREAIANMIRTGSRGLPVAMGLAGEVAGYGGPAALGKMAGGKLAASRVGLGALGGGVGKVMEMQAQENPYLTAAQLANAGLRPMGIQIPGIQPPPVTKEQMMEGAKAAGIAAAWSAAAEPVAYGVKAVKGAIQPIQNKVVQLAKDTKFLNNAVKNVAYKAGRPFEQMWSKYADKTINNLDELRPQLEDIGDEALVKRFDKILDKGKILDASGKPISSVKIADAKVLSDKIEREISTRIASKDSAIRATAKPLMDFKETLRDSMINTIKESDPSMAPMIDKMNSAWKEYGADAAKAKWMTKDSKILTDIMTNPNEATKQEIIFNALRNSRLDAQLISNVVKRTMSKGAAKAFKDYITKKAMSYSPF